MDNNNALLERLEKVIDTLSDNSIKMGQMLAVHDEKLEKQDRIDAVLFEKIKQVDEKLDKHANDIKKGCERDIMLVDKRLRTIEKKMWSIFGALSIISFIVSPIFGIFDSGPTSCQELRNIFSISKIISHP